MHRLRDRAWKRAVVYISSLNDMSNYKAYTAKYLAGVLGWDDVEDWFLLAINGNCKLGDNQPAKASLSATEASQIVAAYKARNKL